MTLKLPFREHHLITLLENYDQQPLALDLFVNQYFRSNKALGSKDREFIAEHVFALIRWVGLLDFQIKRSDRNENPSWEDRFNAWKQLDLMAIQSEESIPLNIRLSFPKQLFDLIVKSHGIDKAKELCWISNHSAPTTIRVNTLKISRDELLDKWKDRFNISPCRNSKNGIIFNKKTNFFSLSEFQEGLFEVQDEGSQLLASLVQPEPGQLVMDYCSGSGGKTLAFAPSMQNRGQIYLHDIRNNALTEAKKRLARAGIQNAQICTSESEKLKSLKKKMNWVLVDAPCTGTGTMRRNPDMKWQFNEENLLRMISLQRSVFEKALSFMHPEGRIVYATCSILNEENEEQLAHFIKTYNLKIDGDPFISLPTQGGMDGFYGVVLKK